MTKKYPSGNLEGAFAVKEGSTMPSQDQPRDSERWFQRARQQAKAALGHLSQGEASIGDKSINDWISTLTRMAGIAPDKRSWFTEHCRREIAMFVELRDAHGAAKIKEAHHLLRTRAIEPETIRRWIEEDLFIDPKYAAFITEGYPEFGFFLEESRQRWERLKASWKKPED